MLDDLTTTFDWDQGDDAFPDHTQPLVEDGRTEARIVMVQWVASALLLQEPLTLMTEAMTAQAKRRKADKRTLALLGAELPPHQDRYAAMVKAHFHATWPWERTNVVLRSVLMTAAAELTANVSLGTGALVNEYTNIAKGFLPTDDVAFVRATLDKLVLVIRPAA